jgi:hypothetical protein
LFQVGPRLTHLTRLQTMANDEFGLASIIDGDLSARWKSGKGRLSQFLKEAGLVEDALGQALYIFPQTTSDPARYASRLRAHIGEMARWACLTGDKEVLAFPINTNIDISKARNPLRQSMMALFIEVHSRLVSWWLVNAWRSQQLADSTWQLGDAVQIIPAAACARSLLETAASCWIETKSLHSIWVETKRDCAKNGPGVKHWNSLRSEINKLTWGAKFDKRAPDLEKIYGAIPRANVLTLVEKLARVTDDPVHEDYQWLCNAVHPSIGGMLSFAAPMMQHDTMTHAFQWVSAFPTHFKTIKIGYDKVKLIESGRDVLVDPEIIAMAKLSTSPESRVATIQQALARSATLAVSILERTLDDALRIIDDIGLTTRAPAMASFPYWRNLTHKKGNTLCPCRSGHKAKHCLHLWSDAAPTVTERFDVAT